MRDLSVCSFSPMFFPQQFIVNSHVECADIADGIKCKSSPEAWPIPIGLPVSMASRWYSSSFGGPRRSPFQSTWHSMAFLVFPCVPCAVLFRYQVEISANFLRHQTIKTPAPILHGRAPLSGFLLKTAWGSWSFSHWLLTFDREIKAFLWHGMFKMLKQPAKFEYLYILSAKTCTMLLWWWGLLLNKVHQDVVTPHMPAVNSSKLQSCYQFWFNSISFDSTRYHKTG